MYPTINAMTERLETIEILGIPGLFSTLPIDRDSIPTGMYAYDMQTSAEDWSHPSCLAISITEQHYGTVITASPITLPENGSLNLTGEDFCLCTPCEGLTVAEFERKYLSPDYSEHKKNTKNRPV